MARKMFFLILTVCIAVVKQQIYAAYVGKERGEDGCATCSEIVRPKPKHLERPQIILPPGKERGEDGCATCSEIVRPKPKHLERPQIILPPVGDNCWCSKTSIQPASLPKPSPIFKIPPRTCSNPALSLPHSYIVPQVNYVQKLVRDNSPPADPISISLANQAGKAIEVPEAKLAYGFVRKPINELPKVYISSIKEENLYALANDIITLKKPIATQIQKIEEDYPEPEEEEPVPEDFEPPSLTYRQIGYETEQFQNPKFIQLPPRKETTTVLLGNRREIGCGFKPGRIAKVEHIRNYRPTNRLSKY